MASEPLLVQRPEEVHQTCFGLKHVSVIINHIDCEAVKVRTKMSEFYIFVWCISSQITGAVGQINENLLNALLCSISERVAAGAKGGACFKGPRLKNKHNQHLSTRLWMLGVFLRPSTMAVCWAISFHVFVFMLLPGDRGCQWLNPHWFSFLSVFRKVELFLIGNYFV